MKSRILPWAAAWLMLLCASSCRILAPLPDHSERHLLEPAAPARAAAIPDGPAVAVARTQLPAYLDRTSLVLRDGEGTLAPSPLALWGEPLDIALARVTAANLRALTGNARILPAADFTALDYDTLIELRIHRFEEDRTGSLRLEASVTFVPIRPVESEKPRTTHHKITRPISFPEGAVSPHRRAPAVIEAMNDSLVGLAEKIAAMLSGD